MKDRISIELGKDDWMAIKRISYDVKRRAKSQLEVYGKLQPANIKEAQINFSLAERVISLIDKELGHK